MNPLQQTPANQLKIRQAHDAWETLLETTLQRGFFGTAELHLVIQDGTIQHIRRKLEQLEK